MKEFFIILTGLVFSVLLAVSLGGRAGQKMTDFNAIEKYLKTAEVVSTTTDYQGRTGAWEVVLDDGTMKKKGFFKHVNRTRPHALPDSYQYEMAAYKLAKLLDIDFVPPLVEREIKGIKGSLQIFMEDCRRLSDIKRKQMGFPEPVELEDALDGLAVFEILTGDQCRDDDDTLVQNETWKVCRVDFSEAFSPYIDWEKDCGLSRCPKYIFENLSALDEKTIEAALSSYLNEEEMKALFQRKNRIIKRIKALIEKHGEENILY